MRPHTIICAGIALGLFSPAFAAPTGATTPGRPAIHWLGSQDSAALELIRSGRQRSAHFGLHLRFGDPWFYHHPYDRRFDRFHQHRLDRFHHFERQRLDRFHRFDHHRFDRRHWHHPHWHRHHYHYHHPRYYRY
jgi:hypothetical protein